MNSVVDRHVVITGGNRGIGLAIAYRFARAGARVSIASRRKPDDARAFAWSALDVTDAASVAAGLTALRAINGEISMLVNNAGIAESASLARTDDAMWARVIATNLTGAFLCSRAVIEEMQRARSGSIVTLSSTAGLGGAPYLSAYTASKHGVIGLMRAIAAENGANGVRANAICPGYTETDMMEQALATVVAKTGIPREVARERLAQMNPGGRIVSPEEVAQSALELCEGDENGVSVVLPGGARA